MSSKSVQKKTGENLSKKKLSTKEACYDFAAAGEGHTLMLDERIVALVRFLARRAAEEDYNKLLSSLPNDGGAGADSQETES